MRKNLSIPFFYFAKIKVLNFTRDKYDDADDYDTDDDDDDGDDDDAD